MFKNTPAFSGYSVDNIEKAKEFYGNVLGVEVEETKQGLNLKIPGTSVFLYPKTDHVPATFTVLNFAVEDIDAAVDALADKGVGFERYEGMHQDEKGIARGKAVGMGPDIAWFKDPAGNILSVLEG
ncbi:MAG: hypothetical protein JWO84_682 [Parcubacteria group bacterium]|nr:hypothetical protein [Parcubacteria group bacterium]